MFVIYLIFLSMSACRVETKLEFPDNFVFGVSTAAYQIEGAWNACGKGENIWDRMVHNKSYLIKDHSTGDVACNSYNLFQDDVTLLSYLGVNFYRFSISWARVLPNGFINSYNENGVKYYRNLISALVKNKIQLMVTLYHWDLPQALQDLGGWANPNMVDIFQCYADLMFREFGMDVKYWITFNEPGEICEAGYGTGEFAPNINSSGIADYMCGKNVLLAHATVYHMYQNIYKKTQKGLVGISISSPWYEPKDEKDINKEAAERAMQMELGWWAHPIYSKTGDYPTIMKERIRAMSPKQNFSSSRLPEFTKSEVRFIRGSWDFFGLNHYTTWLASNNNSNTTSYREQDVGVSRSQDSKWATSSVDWLRVVPWGFRKILNWIKVQYNNPCVIVTENGFADKGELVDNGRIKYHTGYLNAMLEAIVKDGCNVLGYSAWSLIDNMEWTDGYTVKFGLYYINFTDPRRTRVPKLSSSFYKTLTETREIPAPCFEKPPTVVAC